MKTETNNSTNVTDNSENLNHIAVVNDSSIYNNSTYNYSTINNNTSDSCLLIFNIIIINDFSSLVHQAGKAVLYVFL